MSYTRTERDDAILRIGNGNADMNNFYLLRQLESFNWIYIKKANGSLEIELTYSGKDLYKRLKKRKQ